MESSQSLPKGTDLIYNKGTSSLEVPSTIVKVVQFSRSVVSNSLRPHGLQPGLPVHHQPRSLLKLMSFESVIPSNHVILCCPCLLLPSIFPSIKVFSNESGSLHQVAKVLNFSLNTSPSNEHPRLISFTMDWLDLLAGQGTLKSPLSVGEGEGRMIWEDGIETCK